VPSATTLGVPCAAARPVRRPAPGRILAAPAAAAAATRRA